VNIFNVLFLHVLFSVTCIGRLSSPALW